ncbi:MAG: glycosyltransferase family 4 protein [Sedimentisphaerales bacterium]
MKVLFLTYGPPVVASSRTRVFQYLPFFQKEGIRYKVITNSTGLTYWPSAFPFSKATQKVTGKSKRFEKVSYYLTKFFCSDTLVIRMTKVSAAKMVQMFDALFSFFQIGRFIFLAMFYDVLFIQKVFIPTFVFKLYSGIFKKKFAFDFDDAIYANPKDFNKRRLDQQLPLCNLLVLENTFTEEYARQFTDNNILVILGPIDCNRYYPKNQIRRDAVVVGWIGSPATQAYLDMLEDVFKRLNETHTNLIFEFIGTRSTKFMREPFRQKMWNLDTEVADLQNFDIGIMPLPDDEWTRGKGGYKLLQYMAVGIPCIASPVGINMELIKDGENGFLAATEDEWYEKISLLIRDPELRKNIGMRGRNFVVKNYSFEVAAPKLISVLEQLNCR